MPSHKIELLAPAKNATIGIAAINNGADAVYIGAPQYGARKAAANSIQEIQRLTDYAHKFNCRVFVTLNTILYENELSTAEKMIHQLYEVGVDALIVQDMSVLRMDIPPIALHASTQTHNWDIERIKFLDKVGFSRIVLAREMSIEAIKEVRKAIAAEIEVFVHGALCVSFSGQCYMSQFMYGRSANRGDCAQPCRQKWTLKENNGKVLVKDKYLLSLKDMNRAEWIKELLDAGVNSLKIEGRLKDIDYVSNVTQHYSQIIDSMPEVERVGIGKSFCSFVPNPEKSFNRGFTNYFLNGREANMANIDTPKSMGQPIGTIIAAKGNMLTITSHSTINNGDGICFINGGELVGCRVNSVNGNRLSLNSAVSAKKGTILYRNYDQLFVRSIERNGAERKIAVSFAIYSANNKLKIEATDERGNIATLLSEESFEVAHSVNQAEILCNNFAKCGNSEYWCCSVEYKSNTILFVPTAEANKLRRNILSILSKKAEKNYLRLQKRAISPNLPLPTYPAKAATWQYNIANSEAEKFYLEHGCRVVERGFESNEKSNIKSDGRAVMTTKYCILKELGFCLKELPNRNKLNLPLHICNNKFDFILQENCSNCMVKIIPSLPKQPQS